MKAALNAKVNARRTISPYRIANSVIQKTDVKIDKIKNDDNDDNNDLGISETKKVENSIFFCALKAKKNPNLK